MTVGELRKELEIVNQNMEVAAGHCVHVSDGGPDYKTFRITGIGGKGEKVLVIFRQE